MKKTVTASVTCLALATSGCGSFHGSGQPPSRAASPEQLSLPQTEREEEVRIGRAEFAEASTTAFTISRDVSGANPFVTPFGAAAPIATIGLKYGAKRALVETGTPVEVANRRVETGSTATACANLMALTGAAVYPAVIVGIICGAFYYNYTAPDAPAPVQP